MIHNQIWSNNLWLCGDLLLFKQEKTFLKSLKNNQQVKIGVAFSYNKRIPGNSCCWPGSTADVQT